jgi:hypothetical protein
MPEYLLELYVSRADAYLAGGDGRSIREAAEELTRRGTPVRYHRSIFVPAEETCFVLLEADSIEQIHDTTRLANVPCDRLSRAVSHPPPSIQNAAKD